MIAELVNVIRSDKPALSEEDQILRYYRGVTPKKLLPLRPYNGDTLTSVCQGLGDTVMLTDVVAAGAKQGKPRSVFSPSQHFLQLMSFNQYYKDNKEKGYCLNAPDLVRLYDSGNGHYLQRLRRVMELEVEDKPHGFIHWHGMRNRQKVIMHFDPGVHANWQRKAIHKQARMIYPETRKALEAFIASKPGWEFIEVGNKPLLLKGSKHAATANTVSLVNTIATGEWFIGIMSGPMHVATALGLRCVVIINFPKPEKIFLPTLVTTGQVEEEWFYGQNVHLHQDGEGPLVKRCTSDNLKRAMDGGLYPYWSDKYLSLIHEQL